VANNFAGESMTGVHEQAGKFRVEPVQLFYIRVKLTTPTPLPNRFVGHFDPPLASPR
jgi:hypothetical protein